MRIIFAICTVLMLASCLNKSGSLEKDNEDPRITRLEQKVDSLINIRQVDSMVSGRPAASGVYRQTNTCKAITKKGRKCSRKARSGGYCWQHGG